jgi:hypothetical protein
MQIYSKQGMEWNHKFELLERILKVSAGNEEDDDEEEEAFIEILA